MLTHYRCRILCGASRTTGFCTRTSTSLQIKRRNLNWTEHKDADRNTSPMCELIFPGIIQSEPTENRFLTWKFPCTWIRLMTELCCILPGGKILSLSRMRADARSLMIYWRRTYLNTERKGTPSSVLKKGSFSHRSGKQKTLSSNQTNVIKKPAFKGQCFPGSGLTAPVLRLHSQASASARSCLMGPSHNGLSCRNIHCRQRQFESSC